MYIEKINEGEKKMNSDELFEIAYCKGMAARSSPNISLAVIPSSINRHRMEYEGFDFPDLYIESVPEDRSSFFCNSTPFIPVLSKKPSISTAMRQI